ncbi:MAG TPA: hypothetical protein PLR88_08370 [Bacteroidales bacterium]|jgi:hypothetical protein|nr:hypothetical protein [Bacteroidales bacterium]
MLSAKEESDLREIVSRWGNMVTRSLRNNASRFQHGKSQVIRKISDTKSEKKLAASLSYKVRSLYGVPQSVSFIFSRHGVFVQKGVGRGYKMSGGMVIRTAKGEGGKTREPNDWFNSTIDRNLPNLERNIAERLADAAIDINSEKSKIK